MEWQAECWKRWRSKAYKDKKPDATFSNGPEAVELELEVEDWLKANGIPGEALGRIRWVGGDNKIHYVIQLTPHGGIVIVNTAACKWPIWIPNDEQVSRAERMKLELEHNEDEGEGDMENMRRLWARFWDGRRWRKTSIGDPEASIQRMKAEFGIVNEDEAERFGDNHRRARKRQVSVMVTRTSYDDATMVDIRLPHGVKLEQKGIGNRWVARFDTEKSV